MTDDQRETVFRCWKQGVGLGGTVQALKRAGFSTTAEGVRRMFVSYCDRYAP